MSKWTTEANPTQAAATIGNNSVRHTFLFNPDEVKWNISNNTVSRDTIGGRVVQLLSARVEQMTVIGRAGSREELQKFAINMKKIIDAQIKSQAPVFLRVPSRKWNFKVYVQNVSSLGWDYAATSYPYELTLLVQEDLTGLSSKKLQTASLERLAEGIGYNEKFHGGNAEEALAISEGYLNAAGYLRAGGVTISPGGTAVPGDTSGGDILLTGLAAEQQFFGLTAKWPTNIAKLRWNGRGKTLREAVIDMMTQFTLVSSFTTVDVQVGLCVIKHESGWNVNSIGHNLPTNGNESWDYGLWQINTSHFKASWWPLNATTTGTMGDLKWAEYNTRCALNHWQATKGWSDWNAYKNAENGCQPV